MKILIFAQKFETIKIRYQLMNMKRMLHVPIDFIFNDEACIADSDCIIIAFERAPQYLEKCLSTSDKTVMVYFCNFFIDVRDIDILEDIQKELIEAKNYKAVKQLNNMAVKINAIKKSTELKTFPSTIQMEMTNYCNAECIMCAHIYQKNKDAGHIQSETIDAVRPLLPYVENIVLHGNGEPFLNPKILDYLKLFREYQVDITTSTNLSYFNEELAKVVSECFADIRVSCDSCVKEVYEQIRRNLSFDLFLKNVRLLSEKCTNVYRVMTTVIMQQNINQIPDMVKFASEFGFQKIIFSNMNPSSVLENFADSPINYKEEVKYQLLKAKRIAAEIGMEIVYPSSYDSPDIGVFDVNIEPVFKSDMYYKELTGRVNEYLKGELHYIEPLSECKWNRNKIRCHGICDWLLQKTYVDIKGNVYVCCINSSYYVGNLCSESFQDIWNSPLMQKIRSSFYHGELPDFCSNCQFILNHSLEFLENVEMSEKFYIKPKLSNLQS